MTRSVEGCQGMDIIAGLRRRLKAGAEVRRAPRWRPEVTPLEGRALMALNGSLGFVKADPPILAPTGQYVPVTITGKIGDNHPVAPDAFYFVTDEYRTVEPAGTGVVLTPAGTKSVPNGYVKTWYLYTYSFTIQLQAKRSTRTFDGRHYDIFVGATDADGTDGLTTQVFVPKVYPPPVAAAHPAAAVKPHAAARHGHKA